MHKDGLAFNWQAKMVNFFLSFHLIPGDYDDKLTRKPFADLGSEKRKLVRLQTGKWWAIMLKTNAEIMIEEIQD